MLTKSGPKALEYNARFGDPETQTLLPLLNSDLSEIMMACVEKCLHEVELIMDNKFCTVVITSSRGYPGKYSKGDKITISHLMKQDVCHSLSPLAFANTLHSAERRHALFPRRYKPTFE